VDPQNPTPSGLRGRKVAASSMLLAQDSRGPRPRTSTHAHLASVADRVSCAGRQHMHPPSRYSNTESMAVALNFYQSATVIENGYGARFPCGSPNMLRNFDVDHQDF